MKDSPLWFPVVTHEYIWFAPHLEVGPFLSEFILSYVPGPFLRTYEELGRYRELVDLFKSETVIFTCVVFQVQGCLSHWGWWDPQCHWILYRTLFKRFVICVKIKIWVYGVTESWVLEHVVRRGIEGVWSLLVVCSSEWLGGAGT